MTEPMIQVPVSLIERILHSATAPGDRVAADAIAADELRALLSQPTPSAEPIMLTYEGCKAYALGTVVADADGYWSRLHRHYVKTSRNTWASFWKTPTVEEIAEAVHQGLADRGFDFEDEDSKHIADAVLALLQKEAGRG